MVKQRPRHDSTSSPPAGAGVGFGAPTPVGVGPGAVPELFRGAPGTADLPITILLVDDDPDCRLLVRDAIAGCTVANAVYEVENGQEALDFVHRRGRFADAPRPGLIFMDIEMPVVNGLSALRQIKSDPALADIPVVMMTGVCGEEEMQQAAAAGANSYTLKPASAEQFLRVVLASTSYWLEIHQYPRHHWPQEACRR